MYINELFKRIKNSLKIVTITGGLYGIDNWFHEETVLSIVGLIGSQSSETLPGCSMPGWS